MYTKSGKTGLFAILALLPTVAWAQELSVSGSVKDSNGNFITQLDNPVISGSVTLTSPNVGSSVNDNPTTHGFGWEYDNFGMQEQTLCSGGDPYCTEFFVGRLNGPIDDIPAPSSVGRWDGTNGPMPFEFHGLEVGHSPANIEIVKYNNNVDNDEALGANVSLDPQTYLVPINVVVVVPDPQQFPDLWDTMSKYIDGNIYFSLFDDHRPVGVVPIHSVGPTSIPTTAQYYWRMGNSQGNASESPGMTVSSPEAAGGTFFYRPDDVFSQCGVQFRVASITVLYETDSRFVLWQRSNGSFICPGDSEQASAISNWYSSVMGTNPTKATYRMYGQPNQNAKVVFFSWQLFHQGDIDCFNGEYGFQTGNSAAVEVYDFKTAYAGPAQSALSHEIGHLLGLPDGLGSCSSNDLMCENGYGVHIPYCDTWRTDGIAPVNCVSDPNDTQPDASTTVGCLKVRSIAAGLAAASNTPAPIDPPAGGTSTQSWTPSAGTISYNTQSFTEGTASLQLNNSGYTTITSPAFRTADWFTVGNELALDIKMPSDPPWLGSVDMFVTIAAANIYNAYLGHAELSGLPLGQWNTMKFPLSTEVQQAFLGDYPAGTIAIAVNTPANSNVLLDNIRMAGSVQARTVLHEASKKGGNTLFSFDNADDWSVTNGSANENTGTFTQGSGSLSVSANGYTTVTSRTFSTDIVVPVTNDLSIDVYVPEQQPNQYWYGALQMYLACPEANVFNEYIGQQDLTHLFVNEFNTVHYALPSGVMSLLQTHGQSCTFSLALNVNAGSGNWLLDNMAFR